MSTDTPDYEALLKGLVHTVGNVAVDGTRRMFVAGRWFYHNPSEFELTTSVRYDPAGVELVLVPKAVADADRERAELVEKFTDYIRKNVMVSDDYSKRIAKALVELADKGDNE